MKESGLGAAVKDLLLKSKKLKMLLQYKYRLVGAILFVAIIILAIGFFITYQIYISRIEQQTENSTLEIFKQAEESIKQRLSGAEKILTGLLVGRDIGDFLDGEFETITKKSVIEREVITRTDNILSANPTINSIMIINSKGRALGSVRNRTFSQRIEWSESVAKKLNELTKDGSKAVWIGDNELKQILSKDDPALPLIDQPCLVGIKTLIGYGEYDEKCYAIITLREAALLESYFQVLYTEGKIMLLDKHGNIISSRDKAYLNQRFSAFDKIDSTKKENIFDIKEDIRYQVISLAIPQYGFYLINQIPYSSYASQASTVRSLTILVGVVTVLLLAFFCVVWTLRFTKPIDELISRMKEMGQGNLSLKPITKSGIDEIDLAGEQLRHVAGELKSSIEKIKVVEAQKREEELRVLQYQINPHFLYNSLNSIRWMAMMSGAPNVGDALVTLVKIITPILKSPSFFWTVGEEIDFVDNYIKMMSIRYGASLNYKLICEKELYDKKFPRFVLQPLIENCFEHGLKITNSFEVCVEITKHENMLRICVRDTGIGILPEQLEQLNRSLEDTEEISIVGKSIGLRNVNKRLALLYEGAAKMWIESVSGDGTEILIELCI